MNLSVCFVKNSPCFPAASDDFSFHFFKREFNTATKQKKMCQTSQDFFIESTASDLMSGDVQE